MRAQRLDRIEQQMAGIQQRLEQLEQGLREAWATNVEVLRALEQRVARTAQMQGHEVLALDGIELRNVLWSIAAAEGDQRRRLQDARADPGYELAFSEAEPLVSVVIPTRDRPELLTRRSVPSALAQTHANVEVVVVGDAAGPEVPAALDGLDDQRVRFINLTQRTVVSDDPHKHWLVAATLARNEGMRAARGRWTVSLDDDDALRPDAVRQLLELARARRAEVSYGGVLVHASDGSTSEMGGFPPRRGDLAWGAALAHGCLRCFERELVAAEFREPGDAFLLERMLRAGVRFAMLESVVADYHPSQG